MNYEKKTKKSNKIMVGGDSVTINIGTDEHIGFTVEAKPSANVIETVTQNSPISKDDLIKKDAVITELKVGNQKYDEYQLKTKSKEEVHALLNSGTTPIVLTINNTKITVKRKKVNTNDTKTVGPVDIKSDFKGFEHLGFFIKNGVITINKSTVDNYKKELINKLTGSGYWRKGEKFNYLITNDKVKEINDIPYENLEHLENATNNNYNSLLNDLFKKSFKLKVFRSDKKGFRLFKVILHDNIYKYSKKFIKYHMAMYVESETFTKGRFYSTKTPLNHSIELFRYIFNRDPCIDEDSYLMFKKESGREFTAQNMVDEGHISETYGINDIINYNKNLIIDTILRDLKLYDHINSTKKSQIYFRAFRVYKNYSIPYDNGGNLFICNSPTYCYITVKKTLKDLYVNLKSKLQSERNIIEEIKKQLLCLLLVYQPINDGVNMLYSKWVIYQYYDFREFIIIDIAEDARNDKFEQKGYKLKRSTERVLYGSKNTVFGIIGLGLTITAIVGTGGLGVIIPAILFSGEALRSMTKENYKKFTEYLKEPNYILTLLAIIIENLFGTKMSVPNSTTKKSILRFGQEYSDENILNLNNRKNLLYRVPNDLFNVPTFKTKIQKDNSKELKLYDEQLEVFKQIQANIDKVSAFIT